MTEFDPVQTARSFFPPARSESVNTEEILEAELPDSERRQTGLREGLPPGFRMRHDAHYVDQLTARSSETTIRSVTIRDIERADSTGGHVHPELIASVRELGILQPLLVRRRNGRFEVIAGHKRLAAAVAAGLTEVPCLVHQVDDATARTLADADNLRALGRPDPVPRPSVESTAPSVVLRELARNLTAVSASLGLFGHWSQPLRERLAIELARAELQRALWLSQAAEFLLGEALVVRRGFQAGVLVERVMAALGPERRLSGVEIAVEVSEAGLLVNADEDLISVAVAGMVEAMLSLLQRAERGRLNVRALGRATPPALVLEVWQDTVTLPASLEARFFDPAWSDRPGGLAVGIGLGAARHIAELHGGGLDLVAGDRGGCRLQFVIPTGN